MDNKFLTKQQIINELAWVLHYQCWYKETIEGKFGLNPDGTGFDHGRFRKSKNNSLDENFIKTLKFDKNGDSLLKDANGSPYYKIIDNEFYVDSAIKGFDFLPPSWKKENVEAAKLIIKHIENCIDSKIEIDRYLIPISENIHRAWVARQISSETGEDYNLIYFLGTMTVEEVNGVLSKSSKHSEIFKYLGKEKLCKIWGKENFVDFEHLAHEEQIKDINQVFYGLRLLNDIPNEISDRAKKGGYSLERQQEKVEEFIENFKAYQKD